MNTNPGLLGRKIGMTQIYDAEGRIVPVTAVEAGPCTVLQVKIPELDATTVAKLGEVLPAAWSHGNPVDILGDATPDRYGGALEACLADRTMHGVLVMLTPQAMTDPTEVAKVVAARVAKAKKPVLTCWRGEQQVRAGPETSS